MTQMSEAAATRMMANEQNKLLAELVADAIRMHREALRLAVEQSPEAAISYIAENFEEAGIEDADTRKLLDAWWERQPKGGA